MVTGTPLTPGGTWTPAVYSDELPDDPIPLEYGDVVTGAIQNNQNVGYVFEGETGDRITITMVSEEFDTYLVLEDQYGNELTYDDDSAGNLDSRISAYQLQNNGTYTIRATTFASRGGSFSSGVYTLALNLSVVEEIAYGDVVDSSINGGSPNAVYMFQANAGDVVAITMTSDDFTPYLTLTDTYGYQSGYSNYNSGRTAIIGPYTVNQSGEYTVQGQSQSGVIQGDYTLTLTEISLNTLALDTSIEVEVSEDRPAYYTFTAMSGEIVDIMVESNNTVDTSLRLQSPGGYEMLMDENSGDGFDPLLRQVMMQQSGQYVVIVTPAADSGTGSVTLTMTHSALPSLDDGTQQIGTDGASRRALATFSGTMGETVRLNVRGLSSSQAYLTVMQSGMTLYTLSTSTTPMLTFDLFIPNSGDILLSIEDQGYTSMVVTVDLERLGNLPTPTLFFGTLPPGYPTPYLGGTSLPPGFPTPPPSPVYPTATQPTETPSPTRPTATPSRTPRTRGIVTGTQNAPTPAPTSTPTPR